MKINSVSNNNVSFNGWRSWSKENDVRRIVTNYEIARTKYPYEIKPYTFDDVAEVFKWLDKNTPDYDIYLDNHPVSEFGVIVAQNRKNFIDRIGFCISEDRTINGDYHFIDGFKKMKDFMVKLYENGGPKPSPYEQMIREHEQMFRQKEIECAANIQKNLDKLL